MAAVAGSMLALTGPVEAEQCVGRGTTFMHHDVQQTWAGVPATSTVGSSARSIDEHASSSHRDEKGRKCASVSKIVVLLVMQGEKSSIPGAMGREYF